MDSRRIHAECLKELKVFMDKNHISSDIEMSLTNLPSIVESIIRILIEKYKRPHKSDIPVIDKFLHILLKIFSGTAHRAEMIHYFSEHFLNLIISFYDNSTPVVANMIFILLSNASSDVKLLSPVWTLSMRLQLKFLGLSVMSLRYMKQFIIVSGTPVVEVFEWINYIIYMLIEQESTFTPLLIHILNTILSIYFTFQASAYKFLELNMMEELDSILPILNTFLINKHQEANFWHRIINSKYIYKNFCELLKSTSIDDAELLLKYFLLHNRNFRTVLELHKCSRTRRLWNAISDEMTDILFGRVNHRMSSSQLAILSSNIKMLYHHKKFNKPEYIVRSYLDEILTGQQSKELPRFVRNRLEQGPTSTHPSWPMRSSIFGDEKKLLDNVLSIRDPNERIGYIKKIRTFQKALSAKKQLSRRHIQSLV